MNFSKAEIIAEGAYQFQEIKLLDFILGGNVFTFVNSEKLLFERLGLIFSLEQLH
jgi:hypothetical protein